MVKGVNKNVIEISDTGNDCFERAILFVRADRRENDSEQLRRRAAEFLSGLRLRPRFYRRQGFGVSLLKLTVAIAAGAGVATALFLQLG